MLTALLNLLTSASLVICWITKQIKIKQHVREMREMIVVCLELIVIGCSVYATAAGRANGWLKNIQYVFLGVHLAVSVVGLVFMFTFKMNKLM